MSINLLTVALSNYNFPLWRSYLIPSKNFGRDLFLSRCGGKHIKLYIGWRSADFTTCQRRRNQLGTSYNYSKKYETMNYFVIGVSGVTCGGKTTLTKLLQKSFPWCRVIHQDTYFRDDDYEGHVRVPELDNHANYEIMESLDMPAMYEDLKAILSAPGEFFDGRKGDFNGITTSSTPNFDSGVELLKNIRDIDVDVSKYQNIPILIIEGFIIFESSYIFEKCDARFHMHLEEQECKRRRLGRNYIPPDCPGYFEKVVWPEYAKHYKQYIEKRPGITVFDGNSKVEEIWKDVIQIVTCRMEEMYFLKK